MTVTAEVNPAGRWIVVTVAGTVDVLGAPRLRERLVDLVGAGHSHLVVDLAGVEFIDSTGLGVLVGALKRVRSAQGELRLTGVGERMAKVLRVTGLHRVFDVRETTADATDDAATPVPG